MLHACSTISWHQPLLFGCLLPVHSAAVGDRWRMKRAKFLFGGDAGGMGEPVHACPISIVMRHRRCEATVLMPQLVHQQPTKVCCSSKKTQSCIESFLETILKTQYNTNTNHVKASFTRRTLGFARSTNPVGAASNFA